MNDKKVKQLVAKLKKYRIELTKDEKKSKDFLKDAGILTEKDNFTKNHSTYVYSQNRLNLRFSWHRPRFGIRIMDL